MDYMDQIEKDISKMIVIARKKQREREKSKIQEEEDKVFTLAGETETENDAELIATQALIHLLKRPRY